MMQFSPVPFPPFMPNTFISHIFPEQPPPPHSRRIFQYISSLIFKENVWNRQEKGIDQSKYFDVFRITKWYGHFFWQYSYFEADIVMTSDILSIQNFVAPTLFLKLKNF